MKLYYKIDPDRYAECMEKVREEFEMHQDIDEDKTILSLDDKSRIERVIGSYDPAEDSKASIRVILEDESLRGFFDSILGDPYKVKG